MLTTQKRLIHNVLLGYVFTLLASWLLLGLPFCQKVTLSAFDTLFTAASALSTTGLVSVDIGESFSLWGQCLILLLIQLGGIIYLAFSAFLVLSLQQLFSGSANSSFKTILQQAARYSLLCEGIGMIILWFFFRYEEQPLWQALFHSISAFCTAGQSLFSTNFEMYRDHLGINFTLSMLSLLGAFGFFLWQGLLQKHIGLKRLAKELCLSFTFFILLVSISSLWRFQPLLSAAFQVISAVSTAGFNTIPMMEQPIEVLILLIALMLYGAFVTGTCMSLKGPSLGLKIPFPILIFASYLITAILATFLLSLSQSQPWLTLFFETSSAIGTVGLSCLDRVSLSFFANGLLMVLMLGARAGILILSFFLAVTFFLRQKDRFKKTKEEERMDPLL